MNQPNFGARKFLCRVNVCAKFNENPRGSGFFVDSVWNDPFMKQSDHIMSGIDFMPGLYSVKKTKRF